MGSKSTKSDKTVESICARLSKGEPLASICRDDDMPGLRTVYDWMEADAAVSARIARACEEGEESIAADCLSIADDSSTDYRMGERSTLVETDSVQRSKLRIWTRLELLKKWNPKKWGDKVENTIQGGDKPIAIESIKMVVVDPAKDG